MATYQKYNVDLGGLEGNMQAQPRVFAHSAKSLTVPTTGNDAFVDVLQSNVPQNPGSNDVIQYHTVNRGACIYVGTQGNLDVEMESGERVLFENLPAGSFLPILVLKVYGTDSSGAATTSAGALLALF